MGKQLNDVELWEKYLNNGKPIALRNRLAEANLRIIHTVIRNTSASCPALLNEDYDDLFQQGYFGLNSAIEKFVLKEGNYFYKFAYPFVYGRLMSWLRDKARTIRVPVIKHDITMRCFKIKERLIAKGINSPTLEQIFELIPDNDKQLGFEEWSNIIKAWEETQTSSVDGLVSNDTDSNTTLIDYVESKQYDESSLDNVLNQYRDRLRNIDSCYTQYPELLLIAKQVSRSSSFRKDSNRTLQKGRYASGSHTQSIDHFRGAKEVTPSRGKSKRR